MNLTQMTIISTTVGRNPLEEMNKDHSVIFEIAPKYCISDSFVNYGGYSVSSMKFLPTGIDIMVI